MKKYLIVLAMLFVGKCFAQQNFEGKIVYKADLSFEEAGNPSLDILFGKNKIKIIASEPRSSTKLRTTITILDLDSGKIITIKPDDSTFAIKKLRDKNIHPVPLKAQIAGYNVTQLNEGISIAGSEMTDNLALYVSDSLAYVAPEKYKNNKELIMLSKNRIVLGLYMSYANDLHYNKNIDTAGKVFAITIEAQQVIPMHIPDSEFEIPAGYKDEALRRLWAPESIQELKEDTIVPAPITQAPVRKPATRKPVKKTTPSKAPAVIRKP